MKSILNQSSSHASAHFLGHAYLEPLPMGLHLEDDTGVWFGKSISIRNALARHAQLDFGQAGAVKDSQSIGSRLINVAHLLHSVYDKKKRKGHASHQNVYQRRGPPSYPSGTYSTHSFKCWMYLLSYLPSQWYYSSETNKQPSPHQKPTDGSALS